MGCPFPTCDKHHATFGELKLFRQHLSRQHGMSIDTPWFKHMCDGPNPDKPTLRMCDHCKLPFKLLACHESNCPAKRAMEQRRLDPACSEPHWRQAAHSSSKYRPGIADMLYSREFQWTDIALLRKSTATASEGKPIRRIVRHLNTAVIDAMRRGAREMFKVHPDSCEATMIEDVTKLLTLLSLQVQLQDAGNCFEPHPFLDNTLGDAVAIDGAGLPRYRVDGTGTALTRVEGWLRRDYFAVTFAIDQLNAELEEMRQSVATGTAFTPNTTTTTPARNGVTPERYQEPADAAKSRQLRVSRAVALGEVGRGRSALVGNGMRVSPTDERVAKLRSKFKPGARKLRGTRNRRDHPDNANHPAGVPARFDIPNKVTPPEMSRAEVRRCIMTMPRAVGTGIDCIGRTHLEEMVHLEDVTILMNQVLRGGLPPEAVRALAGGTVLMIGKPKAPDDVRPIVPQSMIIRMGGKLLLSSGGKAIKRVVDPWQAAVGVAAGCETMSSIFRQAMYRNRDSVGFVTDKKNGYGETDRDRLLLWFCNELPLFARFILMVYADYLLLYFVDALGNKQQIEVWDGMLQGDVLSALGFTGVGSKSAREAMKKVTDRMADIGRDAKQHELLGFLMRYIDDRADITTRLHLKWYLEDVMIPNLMEDDECGQFIGPRDLKVIIHDPALTEAAEFQPLRDYVQRRNDLGHELEIEWICLTEEDPEGKHGLDLLGVPIGTDAYVRRSLDKRMEKTRRELEMVETIPTQHRLLLLRYCITAELNFWCRALAPSQNYEAVADIERRVAALLRKAMMLPVNEEALEDLPDEYLQLMFGPEVGDHELVQRHQDSRSFREAVQRAMHHLPMSEGGAGINMALVTRQHAFIASQMDVLNSILGQITHYGKLLRAQGQHPPVMGPNMFDELQSNINRQWHHCAHAADQADNPLPPDVYHMLKNHGASQYTRRTGQPYQHRLGRLVHRVSLARVKRIVQMTDPYAAAQMALRGMPGALACLSATGGDNATSLNDEEMAHLLRDLAGIDPQGTAPGPDGQTPPCADCRTDQVVNARHSVVCGAHGDVTRTHTHIMRLIAEAIDQCGLTFSYIRGMEPWVGKIPDGSDKYADLEFTLNGKTVLADVRQVAVQVDNPSALQAAAIVPESVLMIGDRLKMNEYKHIDQQTPGDIMPYTINTETGALGQELTKLFIVLRRRTAEENKE